MIDQAVKVYMKRFLYGRDVSLMTVEGGYERVLHFNIQIDKRLR